MTGSRNGSGTTAHVGCEIFGESDNSGPCYLLDSTRPMFRRGDLNVFIISLPKSLGVIRGVRIWHDNSGKSPSWFLNRAMLRDSQTGEKWIFLAGKNGCKPFYCCCFVFEYKLYFFGEVNLTFQLLYSGKMSCVSYSQTRF